MHKGRYEIFTDVPEITSENVISVLQDAMPWHEINAADETFLLNYDKGEQPLKQEKVVRKEIDIKDIDNVAHEVVSFNLGFKWGNPITVAQRGEKDSGKQREAEAIALLNENYTAEGIETKTQRLARFIETTGLGYTYVDVKNSSVDGDAYFEIEALDPRFTFVVKSSYYIDHRPMLGVTYRIDDIGNTYYTCFTDKWKYQVLNGVKLIDGVVQRDENGKPINTSWAVRRSTGVRNRLGVVPIIEWFGSYDRMGCFEREIDDCDSLNILASDIMNGITQDINQVWHSNDVDFKTEKVTNPDGSVTEKPVKPKSNDWVMTYTSPDGKTPFIKALTSQNNYSGMLQNYITKRELILQKCFVPQRNDDSGGSTGVAMSDATGWSAAEQVASAQQLITESCKMQEVKAVLQAIKANTRVPSDSPLLSLRYMDVKPNIKRQKTYELSTKANAFATLVSHGIQGLQAMKAVNLFEDVNQTWTDSKDTIEEYQDSIFKKDEPQQQPQPQNQAVGGSDEQAPDADKTNQDESDQIKNSPSIDKN